MATYYVSSVSGANTTGATWALAFTSLAGGLAAATASGDIIYVDSAHSFSSGAAINYDVATNNQNIIIISVNRNGSITTGHSGWLAGGMETVGVNAAATTFSVTKNGNWHVYGMTFKGNNGASNNNSIIITVSSGGVTASNYTFQSCTFNCPGTGAAFTSTGSSSVTRVCNMRFLDCTFVAANNNSSTCYVLACQNGEMFVSNATIQYTGATKPPTFFFCSGDVGKAEIVDSDLSGYNTSGGVYIKVSGFQSGHVIIRNCKISATPSFTGSTWLASSNNGADITAINVDSGSTNNTFSYINRLGTILQSTSIYANDGAKFDGNFTSWQIVTTSSCNESEPFICPWLQRWSNSTSAQTLSLEFDHDSATAMHDRNIWAEFEYVSGSSFPQGSMLNLRNLTPFDGSSSNWASGAATWTQAFTNNNPQKISSGSITPGKKSLTRARLVIGVASKTLYLDPQLRNSLDSTSAPTRWIDTGTYNEPPVSATGGLLTNPGMGGGING